MIFLKIGDFALLCLNYQNLYVLPILYDRLYSVVVSTLAIGSEIAGSNSDFTLSLFNFISRKLKLEIIKAVMGSSLTTARVISNM